MYTHEYESMGTHWKITVWDNISEEAFAFLCKEVEEKSCQFDALYSRFKKDSFVSQIQETLGVVEVPREFMEMLVWYVRIYLPTHKKINPCIGFAISDLGYDAEYSLITKDIPRRVPDLLEAVTIIDDTHIVLKNKILFDFGALGKGYFVDIISCYLKEKGCKRFLVDGSGDTYYEGGGESIIIGLEHPRDILKIIGKVEMTKGAMASSAINRRKWGEYHHYIDPDTLTSPNNILATWVIAETTVLADAVASALFFVTPEEMFLAGFIFEYCIMSSEDKVKYSDGFRVKLY